MTDPAVEKYPRYAAAVAACDPFIAEHPDHTWPPPDQVPEFGSFLAALSLHAREAFLDAWSLVTLNARTEAGNYSDYELALAVRDNPQSLVDAAERNGLRRRLLDVLPDDDGRIYHHGDEPDELLDGPADPVKLQEEAELLMLLAQRAQALAEAIIRHITRAGSRP